MGREVRKVPQDWQHPRRSDGKFVSLLDGYEDDAEKWIAEFKLWLGAGRKPGEAYFWVENEPPNPEHYMLVGVPKSARTHLMLYQTTSEGTPCGAEPRVFATLDELCEWAENNATTFADMTTTAAKWKQMLEAGLVTATDPNHPNITFC